MQPQNRPTLFKLRTRLGSSESLPPQASPLAGAGVFLGILGLFIGLTAPIGMALALASLWDIRRKHGIWCCPRPILKAILVSSVAVLLWGGVLIPLFCTARALALQDYCYGNLLQMGNALTAYTQDYDEHFPPANRWNGATKTYCNTGVFFCPGAPEQAVGYAFNTPLGGLSLERLSNPGAVVVVFDAHSRWNGAGGIELADPRHHGRANVVFADGHTSSRQIDSPTATEWIPQLEAPKPVKKSAASPSRKSQSHRRRRRSR